MTHTAAGYAATVDSIDQATLGIPAQIEIEGARVHFEIPSQQAEFDGEWAGDKIEGVLFQEGDIPLTFRRVVRVDTLKRPQEPRQPLPYVTQEVQIQSGGLKLGGALVRPAGTGPFRAVVLLSASGPQDRDGSVAGHKPFLILADALARKGIASLRLDDRGVGKSEGDAASATLAEQVKDAEAARDFLRTQAFIDPRKIGMAGHREGAIVAASVKEIEFVVLLAPPGVPGDEQLYRQGELIARSAGATQQSIDDARDLQRRMIAILREEPDEFRAIERIRAAWSEGRELLEGPLRAQVDRQIMAAATPALRSFLLADPATILRNVRVPALAIFGEKDIQIPPAQNLPAVTAALTAAGNGNLHIVMLPGVNHLLQTCRSCGVTEYAALEETISPVVLDTLTGWMRNLGPHR